LQFSARQPILPKGHAHLILRQEVARAFSAEVDAGSAQKMRQTY
jgi:hypothetical protein